LKEASLGLLLAALLVAAPIVAGEQSAYTDEAKVYTTLTASELLDFRYSFPTIVGTYPHLLEKLRADQSGQYENALETARGEADDRKGDHDFAFRRQEFWRDWTSAGDAFPLLSLQSHVDDFTGGAHGNHHSVALLWDERQDAVVDLDRLFGGSARLWVQIRRTYCRKLGIERLRRKITDSVGCPGRKELTIVPVDSDFNGEFDTLRIIADPYVAGSYAEGTYLISLPITAALLKTIDPKYRSSFEAQRQ
jgi:hypothetical protein